jgi:hypothetical protein
MHLFLWVADGFEPLADTWRESHRSSMSLFVLVSKTSEIVRSAFEQNYVEIIVGFLYQQSISPIIQV